MKLGQIINLKDIYSKLKDKDLPILTKYKLLKLLRSIETEVNFYKDGLSKLLDSYGLKDENNELISSEDGNGLVIDPAFLNEFQTKFQELLNLEVETPNVEFDISEFENSNLSLDELNMLFPFIKDKI